MASIFSFETEPLRVSSPWPGRPASVLPGGSIQKKSPLAGMELPQVEKLADTGIVKLEAEPQDGPVEYKLHLLLRPSRRYSSTSTVHNVSGSHLSKSRPPNSQLISGNKQLASRLPSTPSNHSRQNRLRHLTTQLLWRLQQSVSYHSSSKSSLVLPILPEGDVEQTVSKGPKALLSGLEGSSGALYEIGVSDDGTFVGLARDELEESLVVLRAMAFSLGCNVQIHRMVIVGDCEWTEVIQSKAKNINRVHQEKLWVAEVLVAPHFESQDITLPLSTLPRDIDGNDDGKDRDRNTRNRSADLAKDQVRLSLTGSTTSGKSSLLGTLSTSTLDNGRGKSRLSLLKHRHEIVSGVTSSLAQELIGYQNPEPDVSGSCSTIINYASGNISSWEDIHNASESGRLVFVTDSAGHPRYRRTTVRGLTSWAPDWTLCCIAADDKDDSIGKVGATASASEILGSASVGADLSKAHLALCLKLHLPLVIVITKLDLATKAGLRDTLTKVLSTLKSAGRKPAVLSSSPNEQMEPQCQYITPEDEEMVTKSIDSVKMAELEKLVPIVLTSAVTGCGIGKLHALLRRLPVVNGEVETIAINRPLDQVRPRTLFHIDEVFALPPIQVTLVPKAGAPSIILSGCVRYGSLNVGDYMLIGPFVPDNLIDMEDAPGLPRVRSYPGIAKVLPKRTLPSHELQRPASGNQLHGTERPGKLARKTKTWQEIRITSLRNLRLPVRTLASRQVGTVGITLCDTDYDDTSDLPMPGSLIRRGMVILPRSQNVSSRPPYYSQFSAVFQEAGLPAWPGVLVIVYTASIRASAKITAVRALETQLAPEEIFHFDENEGDRGFPALSTSSDGTQQTEITFKFATTLEWLEIGTQVLVTPGGGPSLTGQPEQREVGSAGLDGFVGKITQAA